MSVLVRHLGTKNEELFLGEDLQFYLFNIVVESRIIFRSIIYGMIWYLHSDVYICRVCHSRWVDILYLYYN